MPYTMVADGTGALRELLTKLGDQAEKAASKGLYEGAGIMADEVERQVGSISTAPFHYAVFITRPPSPEEKAAIEGRVGIAKFEKDGSNVTTAVGYGNAGYADVAGRRKPVPQIANAINSGTSFMPKQPFFARAVNNGRSKSSAAITKIIEEDLEQLTKE